MVSLLGSGRMGQVYLAEHPRLPRPGAPRALAAEVSAETDFRTCRSRRGDRGRVTVVSRGPVQWILRILHY
jgi:serine/threonine-protein kinase